MVEEVPNPVGERRCGDAITRLIDYAAGKTSMADYLTHLMQTTHHDTAEHT